VCAIPTNGLAITFFRVITQLVIARESYIHPVSDPDTNIFSNLKYVLVVKPRKGPSPKPRSL
jgi:hypothetical protein